jgi:hypothetical protein
MMNSLEQMFPSLTLFSDLDWDAVTKEYETDYIDLTFPEYLQQKALDGDCPPYLFELAFYELAKFDVRTSRELFPHHQGVYLNPTALFLSLEFDILKMLEEAQKGNIEIIERPHVLCLYRDKEDRIHTLEISEDELELLQHLEDGPMENLTFVPKTSEPVFKKLVSKGLVFHL